MEKKIKKRGLKIIGLDEAGRGALCGPLVAAAVRVKKSKIKDLKIRDSKKLSPKQREKFYKIITQSPYIEWGMGMAFPQEIDKMNVLQATKKAMERALCNLSCKKSLLVIDGNFSINCKLEQISLVRADEKVLQCSMASVIAKVERDRTMEKYDKIYPCYGFSSHKGYGTKKHKEMIRKHGPCPIHRKSFRLY